MKIACVQMNSGLDRTANLSKAARYIEQSAAEGAQLVVLPEFFNTIFFAQYRDAVWHDRAEHDTGPTITAMREAALKYGIAVVATIYEEVEAGLYFDTAMHIGRDGEIAFKYRKVHPAAVYSLEKIYFRYGTRFDTYHFDEWCVGIGICYDMGFPETARCLAVNGAELLIAPYATPRVNMFREVLQTRAFENGCFLAAANRVGKSGDCVLGGGSMIVDPTGVILQEADTASETLIMAELDHEQIKRARIQYPSRRDRRPDLYKALCSEVDGRFAA